MSYISAFAPEEVLDEQSPALLHGDNDNASILGGKSVYVITLNPEAYVFRQCYTELQLARTRVNLWIAENGLTKTGVKPFDEVEEVVVLDGGLRTVTITKTKLLF